VTAASIKTGCACKATARFGDESAYGPDMSNGLLKIGIIGAAISALCCFTPILVLLLGTIGFSALIGKFDYVLLPAMAIFAGLIIYALVHRRAA
jgi:mercuric ion transport protein